jgi:hypothetical protein
MGRMLAYRLGFPAEKECVASCAAVRQRIQLRVFLRLRLVADVARVEIGTSQVKEGDSKLCSWRMWKHLGEGIAEAVPRSGLPPALTLSKRQGD